MIDPVLGRVLKEIVVGPHAAGLAASPDGRYVCVANANADTVAVIDTERDEVVETISTRPAAALLPGSARTPWSSIPTETRFTSPTARTTPWR